MDHATMTVKRVRVIGQVRSNGSREYDKCDPFKSDDPIARLKLAEPIPERIGSRVVCAWVECVKGQPIFFHRFPVVDISETDPSVAIDLFTHGSDATRYDDILNANYVVFQMRNTRNKDKGES